MNINRLEILLKKCRGLIIYLFFGICSLGVNTVSYYVFAHQVKLSTLISTLLAWFLATLFAYVTNKQYVFESKSWDKDIVSKEAAAFLLCRLFTGGVDIIIMVIGVDKLCLYDIGVKTISNIIVIILNYWASKVIIFRK